MWNLERKDTNSEYPRNEINISESLVALLVFMIKNQRNKKGSITLKSVILLSIEGLRMVLKPAIIRILK